MTRRVCEYHWERTFRQTLCLRALAANVCSSSSCLESDLSCKIGQTMGFSAKLCVSKWRSFVSCHNNGLLVCVLNGTVFLARWHSSQTFSLILLAESLVCWFT